MHKCWSLSRMLVPPLAFLVRRHLDLHFRAPLLSALLCARAHAYAAACSWRGETRLVALCALKAESIVMVIEEGNREAAALVCTCCRLGKGYRAHP